MNELFAVARPKGAGATASVELFKGAAIIGDKLAAFPVGATGTPAPEAPAQFLDVPQIEKTGGLFSNHRAALNFMAATNAKEAPRPTVALPKRVSTRIR